MSCASPPAESERLDDSIVVTKVAPKTDFAGFKTFHLRPEINTISDDGVLEPVDDKQAQPVLNAVTSNMKSRGFTAVDDPKDADLGLEVLYVEHVNSAYWCYSYWYPYYWGYPTWGYYPYWGACDATVWKSGMLATQMTDLTEAKDNPGGIGGGGGEAGAGNGGAGGDGPPNIVHGIWFSGVYSVTPTQSDAVDGINQSFKQSPYIKAGN